MRIAVVVGEYPLVSETFVHAQITGLRERGHEVHVFAVPPGSQAGRAPEPNVHYQPALGRGVLRYLRAARMLRNASRPDRRALVQSLNPLRFGREAMSLDLLRAAAPWLPGRRYDVVHCHFGGNGVRAMMLRELGVLGGPVVTTFHGTDMSAYLRRRGTGCYRRLLAAGELFLPVCNRWRRHLIELGGDPERIRVHHMGVDCTRIPVARGPGPRRVLSVARLIEKKGIAFGIRAFALVARERRDVTYLIVGGGELQPQLVRLAARLGVGDRVAFAGPQSQAHVLQALYEADVFLAPSVTAPNGDEEGIPVALMEAMAAGLPVVASRHSGIPELVAHGHSGLLAAERDVSGLAAALGALLDSPEQRRAMGLEGRARVLADYEIETQNDRLVELFSGVIDERSRAA